MGFVCENIVKIFYLGESNEKVRWFLARVVQKNAILLMQKLVKCFTWGFDDGFMNAL